jgi:hypothetical protein
MPSIGRIQQLSVLALTSAVFGAMVSSASAAEPRPLWLWACQSPDGTALGSDGAVVNGTPTDTCDDSGGSLTFSQAAVAGRTESSVRFDTPPSLTLQQVDATRATTGFGAQVDGSPQKYAALTSTAALESVSLSDADAADVTGRKVFDVTGGWVKFGLTCDSPISSPCSESAPVSLNVARVGLKVTDDAPPAVAVGGLRSPASDNPPISLDVRASDVGSGLNTAEAYVNGTKVSEATFSPDTCRELTPGDATVDLRLDAKCAHVGTVSLPVHTGSFPDGPGYVVEVRVTDLAGHVAVHRSEIEILNKVDLGTNVQQLNIGTSGVQTPQPSPNPNNNSGVLGAQAQSCKSPRLSFSLSQKPMRVSKSRPVLQKNKRYRFTGRLTCVIKGKRVSAPKRTRVDIFNKIGRKTIERNGTTVGRKGRLSIILSYPSSRTITFRFTNSDGKRSQVSIRVKVEKKKKAARR